MCAKSKKSAKAIDRPFSSKLLQQAKCIADKYQIVLACEEGHWYGRSLELSNVFGDGDTAEQCINDTREALYGAVACMLEQELKPPAPARIGRRTHQVNIRVTAEEKLLLETAAKRKGYTGLSDFIRASVIETTR
jgi:predicted RNase H-like HicB family nuclease